MLNLPAPEFYFPVSRNVFSFKAGLNKLPLLTNHNQQKIFQIDNQWQNYHIEKIKARQEDFTKYVKCKKLSTEALVTACHYIVNILQQQQPHFFSVEQQNSITGLTNKISGEHIEFDQNCQLTKRSSLVSPPYYDLLDALCCQLQEDFSIVHVDKDGHDNLAYLHLCFPNHWAAEDKIGKCFQGVHKYVPEMASINKSASQLNATLASQGPFERFTWGISTDNRLNHHPQAPIGIDPVVWQGRNMTSDGPIYLRVERQVTAPFAAVNAYMFSIRTYFISIDSLNREQLQQLSHSISTMPDSVLEYKGLKQHKQILLDRLLQLTQSQRD